jgi:parallel beta helix pectate lyase-like protein
MSLRSSAGVPAVAVLALVLGGCALPGGDDDSPQGSQASASAGDGQEVASVGAPPTPPARICGSKGLAGPPSQPEGATRVTPSQRLDQVVGAAPPGTTFWLTSGVHRLDRGRYASVRPKDGQTFVGAPGAVIDGQHANLYAFTGRATGVTIEHLTIQDFGMPGQNNDAGVVNHDAGHDWRVQHNTIRNNAGAGVFLGSGNLVAHNCLLDNGQYGFSSYEAEGVEGVVLRHNEIAGNNTDDWEHRRPGCGCTGGGKFWETRDARVIDNWIHDNHSVGLWADTNNTGFLVQGNYISDNGSGGVIYETSYNAAFIDNTFVRNGLVDGPRNPGFPTPALYISESGSDPRAGQTFGDTFEVAHNRFVDNWAAVMAWENADRFAGSPANTSTDATTLVNPEIATLADCSDPDKVEREPWVDDCRWKTQHLRVHDNTFRFDPAHLGDDCTPAKGCGFMGLVSNYGTYPDWSPFKGEVVEDDITFDQDNLWYSNRYAGPWRFQAHELGSTLSWKAWREAPYNQDESSTLD